MQINTQFSLIRNINAWTETEGWELLFYYNLYRMGLALLLIALSVPVLGIIQSSDAYLLLALPISGILIISFIMFFSIRRKVPALHIQAHALFLLDIFFISILNLSNLLPNASTIIFFMTTVAASAVIFKVRMSMVYAAICLALILFHDYVHLESVAGFIKQWPYFLITAVGMISIVISVGYIAVKTRKAHNVVERQEMELADMDQLNQLIIDQMELGVVYLDHNLNVKLINERARELFDSPLEHEKVTGQLAELVNLYKDAGSKQFTFRKSNQSFEIHPMHLRQGILLKIDDQTKLNKRIQQSKLASVGRMASGIAHEIRNPLNAISHAAQLLTPADPLNPEDVQLVDIIRKHAKRIDRIIESVSERSRPGKAEQQHLRISRLLIKFIETFRQTVDEHELRMTRSGKDFEIYFDPTQMEQILTNLSQNSIKYAETYGEKLHIHFHSDSEPTKGEFLEICDNGEGIEEEKHDQLFEPFYTSDSQSTGLGLFLVREFCTLNDADIEYFRENDRQGFRIYFQPAQSEIT